jgi:hypothetical protein
VVRWVQTENWQTSLGTVFGSPIALRQAYDMKVTSAPTRSDKTARRRTVARRGGSRLPRPFASRLLPLIARAPRRSSCE